jgi:hypothetical protein
VEPAEEPADDGSAGPGQAVAVVGGVVTTVLIVSRWRSSGAFRF